MGDEIHVVYADVEALADTLATAADSLDALDNNDRYELSPGVATAHDELANRWDERRGDLVKNLTASSAAVRGVAATFLETDEGVAAAAATPTSAAVATPTSAAVATPTSAAVATPTSAAVATMVDGAL